MSSLKDPLISIIVPIFNSEKYLKDCIESILSQTFSEFELILVNDGSTDESKSICDEYAEKDNRIKTIHKQNSGMSDARAEGFKISKGLYIGFVDSDDYISPVMYEKLLYMLKEFDADIACCGYQIIGENEVRKGASTPPLRLNDKIISLWAHSDITRSNLDSKIHIVMWNKLFKRKILEQTGYERNKIRLPFQYFNDVLVTPICILLSKKIVFTEDLLYYYRKRRDSLSRIHFSRYKMELYKAKKYVLSLYSESGTEALYKFILKGYGNQLIKTWIVAKSRTDDPGMQNIISDVWKEYKIVFPKLIFKADCKMVYKISFILFRFSPAVWRLFAKLYPMTHIEGEGF